MKRIKNELYFWLYFYWARRIKPYHINLSQWVLEHDELNEYKNCLKDESKINWHKYSLFFSDYIYISPCSFNEKNCGGYLLSYNEKKKIPKIGFVRLSEGKDD